MKKKLLHVTFCLFARLCIIAWTPLDIFTGSINNEIVGSKRWIEKRSQHYRSTGRKPRS